MHPETSGDRLKATFEPLEPRLLLSAQPFLQATDATGLVVVEAEHHHAVVAGDAHDWTLVDAPAGFVGTGAMHAAPDSDINYNTGYVGHSPRLDWNIEFTHAGTHYLWARGFAISGVSNSAHFGLDGNAFSSADRHNNPVDDGSAYAWSNESMDGPVITLHIPTPGVHTLNAWMREDGYILDRLLLTTDPNYTPTSDGPAESPQDPPPATAAPDLDALSDTGSSADDDLTHRNNADTGSTLSFTVGNTADGAVVKLFASNGGSPVLIGQANATGASTTVTTDGLTPLADGEWIITATQAWPDHPAGDPPASPGLTITIDTAAPALTVDPLTTDDNTPAITGAVDDPNLAVTVHLNGQDYTPTVAPDGSWQLADDLVTALPPGVYDLTATATDAAGNVGADTTTDELEILAPSASISGTVWADLNGDGVFDADEPGMPGVTVYLDENDNGQLDWVDADGDNAWDIGEGERWSSSADDNPVTSDVDETGQYLFDGLATGNYLLRQESPAGFSATSELIGSYLLDPQPGGGVEDLNTLLPNASVYALFASGNRLPINNRVALGDGEGLFSYRTGQYSESRWSDDPVFELNPDGPVSYAAFSLRAYPGVTTEARAYDSQQRLIDTGTFFNDTGGYQDGTVSVSAPGIDRIEVVGSITGYQFTFILDAIWGGKWRHAGHTGSS